jgi:hypothetical protein
MTVESQLFMTQRDAWESAPTALPPTTFGQRGGNHRYKMPLLPGEKGIKALKAGERPWVPGHVQSATNLAGAISESRALGIWEREQGQIGTALRPDLQEKLTILVKRAQLSGDVNFQKLKESAAGKALRKELEGIHDEARAASGANSAGVEGTNRHDAWETRAISGALVGTPAINAQIQGLEALLERNQLVRIPELSERVVRNTTLNCAGRFDDTLFHIPTGRFIMADLKTKRTPFFSLLELWIQLTVYATSEWMLSHVGDDAEYVQGPKFHVDQEEALILQMPADGLSPMRLRRMDLVKGMRYAQLARQVCTARSDGKSVESMSASYWPDLDPAEWVTPTG